VLCCRPHNHQNQRESCVVLLDSTLLSIMDSVTYGQSAYSNYTHNSAMALIQHRNSTPNPKLQLGPARLFQRPDGGREVFAYCRMESDSLPAEISVPVLRVRLITVL